MLAATFSGNNLAARPAHGSLTEAAVATTTYGWKSLGRHLPPGTPPPQFSGRF
jgi:hypothetical protein